MAEQVLTLLDDGLTIDRLLWGDSLAVFVGFVVIPDVHVEPSTSTGPRFVLSALVTVP